MDIYMEADQKKRTRVGALIDIPEDPDTSSEEPLVEISSYDSAIPAQVFRGSVGSSEKHHDWIFQYRSKEKWHDSNMKVLNMDQGMLILQALREANQAQVERDPTSKGIEWRLVERVTYILIIN